MEIDGLYTSPETGPAGWHRKDGLRKELRQQVRYAHSAGLREVQEVATRVEDYALRQYLSKRRLRSLFGSRNEKPGKARYLAGLGLPGFRPSRGENFEESGRPD